LGLSPLSPWGASPLFTKYFDLGSPDLRRVPTLFFFIGFFSTVPPVTVCTTFFSFHGGFFTRNAPFSGDRSLLMLFRIIILLYPKASRPSCSYLARPSAVTFICNKPFSLLGQSPLFQSFRQWPVLLNCALVVGSGFLL